MTIMTTIATVFAWAVIVLFFIGAFNGIVEELRRRGYEVRYPADAIEEIVTLWREILGGYILAVVLYTERRWRDGCYQDR